MREDAWVPPAQHLRRQEAESGVQVEGLLQAQQTGRCMALKMLPAISRAMTYVLAAMRYGEWMNMGEVGGAGWDQPPLGAWGTCLPRDDPSQLPAASAQPGQTQQIRPALTAPALWQPCHGCSTDRRLYRLRGPRIMRRRPSVAAEREQTMLGQHHHNYTRRGRLIIPETALTIHCSSSTLPVFLCMHSEDIGATLSSLFAAPVVPCTVASGVAPHLTTPQQRFMHVAGKSLSLAEAAARAANSTCSLT